jgi:NTP pyrophosphatase (non-canonical NTP hydrolase)
MTREQKQQCKQIFKRYGTENQLEKLKEELNELYEAVVDFQENPSEANRNHLAEELADVEIVSKQIKSAVAGDEVVNQFVQYKLNRQLKRIEDESLSGMPERV